MNKNDALSDVLSLEYYGERVDLGRMNSYQVAANIIAFSNFLGIISKNAFGEKVELKTEIQGIRNESFDIDFYLYIGSLTLHAFAGYPIGLKDFFDIVKESINVWKHLKGKPPKEIIQQSDNKVNIVNGDGQFYYANNIVVNVISDTKAGDAAEQFIGKPLEEGISHLTIKSSSLKDSTTINNQDASYFKQIELEKPLTSSDIRMGLQIESPTFKEDNKWKFFDGQNSFYADIQDEEFIRRVNEGVERFGKGDTLIAIVRISQTTSMNNLKLERSIIKVIEHTIAPEQKKLMW